MGEWITRTSAFLSAVFASIGYFAPLLAARSGITDFVGLASLAIYRPYFIGLAGLALVYSSFTMFRKKYRSGRLRPRNYALGKDEIVLATTTLLVLLAIFAPYMGGAPPGQETLGHAATGVIIHVDPSGRKVTLAHTAIEGVLPATTMEYGVESPDLLRGVKSGDSVRFTLSPQGLEFVVVEIAKRR